MPAQILGRPRIAGLPEQHLGRPLFHQFSQEEIGGFACEFRFSSTALFRPRKGTGSDVAFVASSLFNPISKIV